MLKKQQVCSLIKELFTLMIFFTITSSLLSQNIVFTLDNGLTESYPISEVQSIKFNEGTLVLNFNNGSVLSYSVGFIDNYAFNNVTSLNDIGASSSSLYIYPNPTTDRVNIQFESQVRMNIAIDILDVAGKHIESIFNGQHLGLSQYVWQPDKNEVGIFICRIQSDHHVITKTIVVQ